MEFISAWITQIILFIIVATIIDLMVPDLSMKKYIKLVLGLVLILLLLQPIFSLFQLDFEAAIEDAYTTFFETDSEIERMENSIEMQKNEIESTYDAYILEEMAVQLKSLTDEALLEEFQVQITAIDFVFEDEEEKTYEGLVEVIVYLEPSVAGYGQVEPIEEIIIGAETEDVETDDEAIITLLRDTWELRDKQITVIWEGGTS